MNKKHFTQFFIFSMTFSLLFSACVSEKDKRKTNNMDEEVEEIPVSEASDVEQIKKIFFSLPSPIELTYLFKKEGINYQADKLHSIAARNNYNLTTKKALNLGVYGADLSYAGLFGQHEDAIEYYTTCQILAEEIGIGQTFKKEFISRIEENANNRDTLMQVISDFFLDNDAYLKDHRQQFISTYVLLGGWVEGMYLGTQMEVNTTDSMGIRTIIAGQKHSLENLNKLLYKLEDSEGINILKEKMTLLEKHFEKIDYTQPEAYKKETTVEKNNGKIILNTGSQNPKIDPETFAQIKGLVKEIRTLIVQ
ncbi:MAG: hypothetical protein WD530_02355 [Vicingaceae bacterium]